MCRCSVFRLAKADIVLTTYNIVSREVQIPDALKDKHAVDMPATDAAMVCLVLCNIQGSRFSATNSAKFRGTDCEILWHCYPEVPYILRPVGVVVLTDNPRPESYKSDTLTTRPITPS